MEKTSRGTILLSIAIAMAIFVAICVPFAIDYFKYRSYIERYKEPVPAYFFYENYSDAPERSTPDAGEFILKRAEADLIKYAPEDHEKMAFYIMQHHNDISANTDLDVLENLMYTGYVLNKSSSNETAAVVGECALYLSYDLYAEPIFSLDDLTEILSQFQKGVNLLFESEQSF